MPKERLSYGCLRSSFSFDTPQVPAKIATPILVILVVSVAIEVPENRFARRPAGAQASRRSAPTLRKASRHITPILRRASRCIASEDSAVRFLSTVEDLRILNDVARSIAEPNAF